MGRYIDAEHLLSEIQELKKSPWFTDCTNEMARVSRKEAVEIIEALCINREPSADVRPNVRGEWSGESGWEECSECHWVNTTHLVYHFCPNCGADMRQVGGNTE